MLGQHKPPEKMTEQGLSSPMGMDYLYDIWSCLGKLVVLKVFHTCEPSTNIQTSRLPTMWGPLVIRWFITPSNYTYK